MAITAFDTYKFIRRLEQAGMPVEQAEVQAEVLMEAFTVNLEALVPKEHLNPRFAEQQAYTDTRFAEQGARIDWVIRYFGWTQAVILTAVIFPYLQRLFML